MTPRPERDIVAQPYSADEQRVADWLRERGGIGAGDDPVGFLLSSYQLVIDQRNRTKGALEELWQWISNWSPPMIQDKEWPQLADKVAKALYP